VLEIERLEDDLARSKKRIEFLNAIYGKKVAECEHLLKILAKVKTELEKLDNSEIKEKCIWLISAQLNRY